jgi:hypothetical protein
VPQRGGVEGRIAVRFVLTERRQHARRSVVVDQLHRRSLPCAGRVVAGRSDRRGNERSEGVMPVILWLLGVPLGLVILLMLLGVV